MDIPGRTFSLLRNAFHTIRNNEDEEKGQYATLDKTHATPAAGSDDSDSEDEKNSPALASQQTVSEWKSAFNVMNFMAGGGFLAVPYAIKIGGISALLSLVLVPCVLWYTGKVLIDCLYTKDGVHGEKIRVRETYRDIGEACLPRVGGILVDIFLYGDLFTGTTSLLILSSALLSISFPFLAVAQTTWTLLIAAVILPTIFIQKLGEIAWLSVFGVLALLGVVVATVSYGLSHISTQDIIDRSSQLLFWDTENVAVGVGASFFCYISHAILTDVEESMAERDKFGRALFEGYIGLTTVKISYVLVTFWAFGENTQEVIVQNLPAGAICITVTTFYVISLIFTFAIPVHAFMHNLEHTRIAKYLMSSVLPNWVWFFGTRLLYFFLVVLTAVQIPHYVSAAAFFGSLLIPLGSLVYPCAFHVMLKHKELSLYELILDMFLATVGSLLWAYLLYFTSKSIFNGD